MKKLIILTEFTLALAFFDHQGMAQGTTAFYFASSPNTVSMGLSGLLTTNGYSFTASRNFYNGVSVRVQQQPGVASFAMDFAAPANVLLANGDYLGVTRYPFQTATTGGLNYSAYGNGDNTLTGYFTVLEVSYGSGSTILSFAADFMQYDYGQLARWNQGSIRFNSVIPVPEPDPSSLLLSAIAAGFVSFRCRKLRRPAEHGAALNGGPATWPGSSGVTEGPPSVS